MPFREKQEASAPTPIRTLLLACAFIAAAASGVAAQAPAYENMPEIPAVGVRTGKYMDIPASALGPPVDAAKGYRIQTLGRDLYMVTDNGSQAMFLVYEQGVVLADAPPSLATLIPRAIAEVTERPITHVIYSHSHADHIGGAGSLGGTPIIIAHEETKRILTRANDTRRPIPTVTFTDHHVLNVGSHRLELSYHGNGHQPGNIFIYAPEQKALMVIDVVFPGWMMWRRFALAQDVPGYFAQVERIKSIDFDTFVGGHVQRTGTRADVELQSEFMNDLESAAGEALRSTTPGEGLDPRDRANVSRFPTTISTGSSSSA